MLGRHFPLRFKLNCPRGAYAPSLGLRGFNIERRYSVPGNTPTETPVTAGVRRKPRRWHPWTTQEVAFLNRAWAENHPIEDIAQKLNRNVKRCYAKKSTLRNRSMPGSKFPEHHEYSLWTTQEQEILRQGHSDGLSVEEIAQMVGRSARSCENRITKVGLRRKSSFKYCPFWTTEEDDILKRGLTAENQSIEDISQKLGRSVKACDRRKRILGLFSKFRTWTPKDIEILKQGRAEGELFEHIAQKLGRTSQACKDKALRLGLREGSAKRWSDDEVEILKQICRTHGYPHPLTCAQDLPHRTTLACQTRAWRMGL